MKFCQIAYFLKCEYGSDSFATLMQDNTNNHYHLSSVIECTNLETVHARTHAPSNLSTCAPD
jgi:hypothetical protein